MQKTSTALLAAMVICSLSLWGCTNQKSGAASNKIRELEIRHAKLEEDYRVILAANETNRRKIQQLETTRTDLTNKIEELQSRGAGTRRIENSTYDSHGRARRPSGATIAIQQRPASVGQSCSSRGRAFAWRIGPRVAGLT